MHTGHDTRCLPQRGVLAGGIRFWEDGRCIQVLEGHVGTATRRERHGSDEDSLTHPQNLWLKSKVPWKICVRGVMVAHLLS